LEPTDFTFSPPKSSLKVIFFCTGFGSASKKSFYVGQDTSFSYYIQTVSLDGTCSALQTQIPNGVVSDWAYNAISKQAYAALATTTSGVFIFTIELASGQIIDKATVENTLVPNAMQFVYVS
jgi:hypothetical protein